ncbi:MAG TPA: biopolymer transporter ExbD [Lacipirellulaceae bacterium]
MSIRYSCPNCDQPLVIPDELAGKRRKCPKCGAKFTVPLPDGTIPQSARPKRATSSAAAGPSVTAEGKPPATDHPLLLMRPFSAHTENLVDMTAMVDIVFFLLIFFLVTSLQSVESVINLPAPQASESGAGSVQTATDVTNDPKYLVVTIDEDDTVWVGDEKVFGEQALRAKLRDARKADSSKSGMLVVGDADASHGTLVMVLDAGVDAGMKDLLFSVREGGEAAGG